MKFRASYSAPMRLQRANAVEATGPGSTRPLWLVGADLCVFTRIDLRAVPERHRPRALAERARQLAPFAEPAWHSCDRDGDVALWFWDGALVREAIALDADPARGWQVLPEQVYFAPAADACLRDLGEAQLLERWRDGQLVFSALLPRDPRERALRFRAAGLAVDSVPPPAAAERQAERWDRRAFDWRRSARDPVAAAVAALAGATLWLLWSGAELAGWQIANARLQQRIESREEQLAPLLEERARALELAARTRTLAEQFSRVNALEAAAEFEYLVGGRYQRLLQWEFNGRGMRVVLEDPAPDNRAYVEALGRSPWFERVNLTPAVRPEQISLDIALSARQAEPPVYATQPAQGGGH